MSQHALYFGAKDQTHHCLWSVPGTVERVHKKTNKPILHMVRFSLNNKLIEDKMHEVYELHHWPVTNELPESSHSWTLNSKLYGVGNIHTWWPTIGRKENSKKASKMKSNKRQRSKEWGERFFLCCGYHINWRIWGREEIVCGLCGLIDYLHLDTGILS